MTTPPFQPTYRTEPNPSRVACQFCTERPATLHAVQMPTATVRVCSRCLARLFGAVSMAMEFEDVMQRVRKVMED